MDEYTILGIATTASREQIDAAYREHVKRLHPDVGGDAQLFKRVQVAYESLTANGVHRKSPGFAGRSSTAAARPQTDRKSTAKYDAAEAARAEAAAWKARERARAEQRAATIAARQRTVQTVPAAKENTAPPWSTEAARASVALAAIVTIGFDFASNGWDDWRLAILVGSILLAPFIAPRFERPVMAVVAVFIIMVALMVAATWCVGLAQAIEYEKDAAAFEYYPERRAGETDEDFLKRKRSSTYDPSRANEFFRISDWFAPD